MIRIARKFTFEASHKLPHHTGACKNLHGHSYKLLVEVRAPLFDEGPEMGMVMDYGKLKGFVNDYIISRLDHTHLNDLFVNPTAELMLKWIVAELKLFVFSDSLSKVRLEETGNSYAEWRVEDASN